MRGRCFLVLASLSFRLLISNQPARAENSVTCIPQFAEGFDGHSIWETQLFIDGRSGGADQAVITAFGPRIGLKGRHILARGGALFAEPRVKESSGTASPERAQHIVQSRFVSPFQGSSFPHA